MNREEATSLLKELNRACDGLGEQGIMLMPPNAGDILSKGYQLHIKSSVVGEKLACLKKVVEKYKLAIANDPKKELLIIYRPL